VYHPVEKNISIRRFSKKPGPYMLEEQCLIGTDSDQFSFWNINDETLFP
jgi:hypothetical protein